MAKYQLIVKGKKCGHDEKAFQAYERFVQGFPESSYLAEAFLEMSDIYRYRLFGSGLKRRLVHATERFRRAVEDRPHQDDKAREWLAEKGFDPVYGARPLKRAIQRSLQNPLAGMMLEGKVSDGDAIRVSAGKDGLIINGEVVAEAAV